MNIINLIFSLFNNPFVISLVAMATIACYYYIKNESKQQRRIAWLFYLFLFVGIVSVFIKTELYLIHHPRVWDFTAFYLYGRVAASGYNFYLPENFQIVSDSLSLPFQASELTDFIEAVVEVGFPYPPPTILYVMPLGFLSYKTALIVWTLFLLFFLFGCIYIISNFLFKENKLNGLILVAILIIIFPSAKFNLFCTQTNFILLFYLLLMKKYSYHKFSGILLALAFFTKPFMIIFGLFFLISKNWKPIAYFIVSASIITGISLMVVGVDPFISYFLDNPAQRMPEWQFSEDVNQSLNAVLLRANIISLKKPHVYLIISAILLGLTILFSSYLVKRKFDDIVWVLLLLVGLLIYPGTLGYYGVLLLFIMFQFFKQEQALGLNSKVVIPLIGLFYYLDSISVFVSICFLLFIVIIKTLLLMQQNQINEVNRV